jgi:hypothetical protein
MLKRPPKLILLIITLAVLFAVSTLHGWATSHAEVIQGITEVAIVKSDGPTVSGDEAEAMVRQTVALAGGLEDIIEPGTPTPLPATLTVSSITIPSYPYEDHLQDEYNTAMPWTYTTVTASDGVTVTVQDSTADDRLRASVDVYPCTVTRTATLTSPRCRITVSLDADAFTLGNLPKSAIYCKNMPSMA